MGERYNLNFFFYVDILLQWKWGLLEAGLNVSIGKTHFVCWFLSLGQSWQVQGHYRGTEVNKGRAETWVRTRPVRNPTNMGWDLVLKTPNLPASCTFLWIMLFFCHFWILVWSWWMLMPRMGGSTRRPPRPRPPQMKISLPRHDLPGEERWPISQRRRAKSLFLNGLLLGSICTGIQIKLVNHRQ